MRRQISVRRPLCACVRALRQCPAGGAGGGGSAAALRRGGVDGTGVLVLAPLSRPQATLREEPDTHWGKRAPEKEGLPLVPAFCWPTEIPARLTGPLPWGGLKRLWQSLERAVGLVLTSVAVRTSREGLVLTELS